MARVTLIDEKDHPELAELVARVRGARGGRLLNLYRMLLNSPDLADAWLAFNSAVRYRTELDPATREMIIMRVAVLNGVDYILRIHGSRYAGEAGLTRQQVAGLSAWHESGLFSAQQRALLGYVDAMTRDIDVPDEVFDTLRRHYGERQTVEITVLVGAYNMHTRVLKALRIDPEPGRS